MVETAPSQVRGGFFVRYTQAGLLTQTFKRTSPSSRNKHPSDIAERHSANTATALCGILTRLPFSSARQPPHETFMTDFSIRATAKNVNKERIKVAKVAVVGDFHLINFPCDKTVLQCYYVPAIPLEYVKDPSVFGMQFRNWKSRE